MQYHSTLSPSDKTNAQGMCHGLALMHDSGKHNSPKHNVKLDLTQVINIGRVFGKRSAEWTREIESTHKGVN